MGFLRATASSRDCESSPDDLTAEPYDQEHAVTYARLLDAEKDNADWREVARIILHIIPTRIFSRHRCYESHLIERSGRRATVIAIF